MNSTTLERQLSRSRARVKRLQRQAARRGVAPESPQVVALKELEQTLEELSATLEQLAVGNEELHNAQQEAERHALRYRDLFQSAPDAYLVTDERGVIRDANRAAELKLGRESRYLAGKPLLVYVAKEHRKELEHQLVRMQRAHRTRIADWELRFAPRNAEPFWAALTAEATREPDGTVVEIRWLLRDVTERRNVEEALRASEARAHLMADHLPALISFIDRDERYQFANFMYERWFGIPSKKVVGRHMREILGDAAYGRVRDSVARALAGESARFEGEVRYARGGTRHISASYVPYFGESGDVLGVYSLISDVTEQTRMREQLRAAVSAASRAEDRERRRLAQDLHDDLGQLLSLASIKLGALRDAMGAAGAAEKVREIEKLIREAHSHTESLTFQLSPPILHDRGFVPAAEWLAEDLTRSYGLRVLVEDDGQPKPLDEASRVELFRSLRELLINVARHAGSEEAYVRICRNGDRVHVEVLDHGLGFDAADTSGGFGLVSVRERLHNLGGRLEIESAPGEGARVIAEVPVQREEQP